MIDPNNPAFPTVIQTGAVYATHGLTIRAEFAKAAMQGYCVSYAHLREDLLAAKAVTMADALIAELNKKESV
jgi:hypothetical protein